MDTVYIITRTSGKKKCYDFIRRLEKEEGFKKGFFKENGLPFKQMGISVEEIEHDSRI